MSDSLRLTVRAAEKRDAGRGIARLPEGARQELGLLSGDTVLIEGERETVAKLWPARGDVPDGVVRIDADSRANAGVKVGDAVRVAAADLPEADSITLRAPTRLADVDVDRDVIERLVAEDVRNRPVAPGDQLHLERLSGIGFTVDAADPDGRVRVTDDTRVRLVIEEDSTGSDHLGEIGSPSEEDESGGVSVDTGESTDSTASESASEDVSGGAVDVEGAGGASTGINYEDIGGLDEELDLVRETVELPLSNPELFARLGIDPPKGVLLHGPPGTGKTLIAKAVANEVDATFISISGPEIMSKYKGESEERVREVFEAAQADSPAIIFFDEIDSVAPKREDGGDVESRVVGQLLSLMDGLAARGEVVVIGATNRVDEIDPALRRGGRFDREIEIGVPGETGRREILQVHTRNMPLADDVRVDRLAERTHGFTGADLASVAKEAAMSALRRARRQETASTDTDPATAIAAADIQITRADFESALAAVEPSAMREYVAESPEVGFDDVGGLEDAKETLERAVAWPLTYGPLFDAVEASPPSGVLLHGPPGTGKTLLARAIAGESGVNFLQVAGPELLDRYVGESEKAVRELFERARQAAPAVVFFDEIDAVAIARGSGSDSGVGERVVSQLLTELDRAADNPNLVVLAATNRKDALDPALLRPGRFESHVLVPAPGEAARRAILDVHVEGKPLADDVDLDAVASAMAGYTGADVAAVVREATLLAVEDVANRYEGEEANEHADEILIGAEQFERALDAVEPSI